MARKSVLTALSLFLGVLGTCSCALGRPSHQATSEQAEIERFLATAQVLSKAQPMEKGRNDPWMVILGDGKTTRRAIFKYIDRPKPEALASSYKHELAAYALSKILGIDVVPPVVARRIENLPGSLQVMVEGCITESERQKQYLSPPDPQAFSDAVAEVRVLEHLTHCERSDLGDMLIHKDTWKVCRVDFAEGFGPEAELLPEADIRRCSKRLYERLKSVPAKAIEETVRPHLERPEIEALLARRKLILDRLDSLIKENGESAVLFDIVRK
jgi:hypothetical protein